MSNRAPLPLHFTTRTVGRASCTGSPPALCYHCLVNVTARLASFVAGTGPDEISPEAQLQARRAILDTLGVILAGSREDASRIVAEWSSVKANAWRSLLALADAARSCAYTIL